MIVFYNLPLARPSNKMAAIILAISIPVKGGQRRVQATVMSCEAFSNSTTVIVTLIRHLTTISMSVIYAHVSIVRSTLSLLALVSSGMTMVLNFVKDGSDGMENAVNQVSPKPIQKVPNAAISYVLTMARIKVAHGKLQF